MFTKKALWITLSLFLIGSLLLVACNSTGQPAAEEPAAPAEEAPAAEAPTESPAEESPVTGNLVMLDWAGYELPEFWGDFAAKYPDVQVDFSFLTESAEVYSKLESGFEADLVHPCSNLWQLLVDSELVQPIDTSKLSNWSGVPESLAQDGQFNGEQYWVPWDWGFESILVRTDLVDKVPESWADIWDPQYAGHIAINDSGEAAHVFTALSLGYDPWQTTPEQDEEIRQKLLELAPNVLAYWSGQTELDQMLASGDAWLGVGAWNASYVSLLDEGYEMEYIVPKEGRTGFLCGFGIPSTSKNVDLAHEMIDAYLAVDSMAYLANEYGYGIANIDALTAVDPNVAELLSLNDAAVIDSTTFYEGLTPEQRELWTNVWSEVKTSQ
ncbi:MAG: extracellular solute-binding protein [Ardenticatenaceae bacterium]|nr:extracellular solute-binding protein [Ardenticatenaceae bacterium]MCB9444089.1 extracellular solute-binding protein [Ardenticatenaceae bacterium]